MMEQKRLGDIATYINGFAFKPEDRGTVGLPIIRIQDLTGNAYDLGFYDGNYPERIEINDGDVLISWSASLGVYVWNKGKALLNQHIFKVAFDKCEVNREYFVYAVRYKLKEMESKTHGATMKHIVKKDFDNTLIPFPAFDEQRRIAESLDTAYAIITARQQQLQNLDELVKARFVEMFGDLHYNRRKFKIVNIEEVCTTIKDGTHQTPQYTTDNIHGFKFLSSKDVMSQKVDWKNIKYIPSELHEKLYATLKPQRNDILMSKNGVNYGVAAVNDSDEVFDIYVSLALLRPKPIINPIYFKYVINNQDTKEQFDLSIKGIGVPNLHLREIKKTKILLPPIELQNQFATFVEQTDKSKAAVQKSLDEAQLLFDSLMQRYFE